MVEATHTDDLVRLGHDPATGRPLTSLDRSSAVLAGGLLLELAASGRIRVEGDRVHALTAARSGDPAVDAAADAIGALGRPRRGPRRVGSLVQRFAQRRYREWILEAAVRHGAVTHGTAAKLVVLTTEAYRPSDPEDRERLRAHLEDVVTGALPADPRSLGLLACLGADLRLRRALFPGVPRCRKRIEELTLAHPPSAAVFAAVADVEVSSDRSAFPGIGSGPDVDVGAFGDGGGGGSGGA